MYGLFAYMNGWLFDGEKKQRKVWLKDFGRLGS